MGDSGVGVEDEEMRNAAKRDAASAFDGASTQAKAPATGDGVKGLAADPMQQVQAMFEAMQSGNKAILDRLGAYDHKISSLEKTVQDQGRQQQADLDAVRRMAEQAFSMAQAAQQVPEASSAGTATTMPHTFAVGASTAPTPGGGGPSASGGGGGGVPMPSVSLATASGRVLPPLSERTRLIVGFPEEIKRAYGEEALRSFTKDWTGIANMYIPARRCKRAIVEFVTPQALWAQKKALGGAKILYDGKALWYDVERSDAELNLSTKVTAGYKKLVALAGTMSLEPSAVETDRNGTIWYNDEKVVYLPRGSDTLVGIPAGWAKVIGDRMDMAHFV
eukprot:CAMPEP_0180653282 /NCGR_PEP_ID=MMETSP1037_2-20121125/53994_1 /TAXON_ID=632150 /ORGANISM="Azadinium spinosum, Strain 3D9" /LENGTH=333 /DNA_ID=CAMNT_0022679305 /DNA_START=33 /DNA_END=1031 /DNA_ORIENTATION=+